MRKVRFETNGLAHTGSKLVDVETGEAIQGVQRIQMDCDASDGFVRYWIEMVDMECQALDMLLMSRAERDAMLREMVPIVVNYIASWSHDIPSFEIEDEETQQDYFECCLAEFKKRHNETESE